MIAEPHNDPMEAENDYGRDGAPAPSQPGEDELAKQRREMVRSQLRARDVTSKRVLEAMNKTPRHKFVPCREIAHAYEDRPLPIGMGQTISQPYIVALMTQCLDPQPDDKILEVGCGCGYQAAVLAELAREVHTVEILEPLARRADELLRMLGYSTVHVHVGDGYWGWMQQAPYDGIIVTAAPERVPYPLKDQLKPGARLVIPVGQHYQRLLIVTRTGAGFVEESILDVRFVPMTGEAEGPDPRSD